MHFYLGDYHGLKLMTVKIVREQRRMANLALRPDTELRHFVTDRPELVIRRGPSQAPPNTEQGEQ
jgi:hypothetical protein